MTLARNGLALIKGRSVAGAGAGWICSRCAASISPTPTRLKRAVATMDARQSTTSPTVSYVSGNTLYVQRAPTTDTRTTTWNIQQGIRFQNDRPSASAPVQSLSETMSLDSRRTDSAGGSQSNHSRRDLNYSAKDMSTQTDITFQSRLDCPRCIPTRLTTTVPGAKRTYTTRAALSISEDVSGSTQEDIGGSLSQPWSQGDESYVPSEDDFPMSREEMLAYAKLPIRDSKVTDEELLSLAESVESLVVESLATAADEKHVSLDFQIPAAALEAAQKAEPESRASYWSHKLYKGTDDAVVKVHYCATPESADRVAKLFADEDAIGFDLEWKVFNVEADSVRDNVSLIQLASASQIALFHVAKFPKADKNEFDMPSFKKLMQSPAVTKCGVNILGDANRLSKFMNTTSQGLFELSHLYRLVKCCSEGSGLPTKRLVALALQVQEHLQLPLDKSQNVRCGDWSKLLNQSQVEYAADDAYAGVQLFNVLEGKRKSLDPCPPRPAFAELLLPIAVANPPKAPKHQRKARRTRSASGDEELSSEESSSGDDFEASASPIPATGLVDPAINGKSHATKLVEAQKWASQRQMLALAQRPAKAPPSSLRAYALWHREGLSLEDVAATLRTPPLMQSTVSCYIIEAVRTERLAYDHTRICEIFDVLPEYAVNFRFKEFIATVRGDITGEDKTAAVAVAQLRI